MSTHRIAVMVSLVIAGGSITACAPDPVANTAVGSTSKALGNPCQSDTDCYGQVCCAGFCADVRSDVNNCGTCGTTCPTNSTCVGGGCKCNGLQTQCGGACVDTTSDNNNCGQCGLKCTGNLSCQSPGFCGCPGTTVNCSGVCLDVSADVNNCGDCGFKCKAGQSCYAGVCGDSVCKTNVLLLADSSPVNTKVVAALKEVGLSATYIVSPSYNNVPPASDYGLILLLPGDQYWNYGQSMPLSGQQAIVDAYMAGGTGVLFDGWGQYNNLYYAWSTSNNGVLGSLGLLQFQSWNSTGGGTRTYTQTAMHPIWMGVAPSFQSTRIYYEANGSLIHGGTQIGQVQGPAGWWGNNGTISPHIAVKDGASRIVHYSSNLSYCSNCAGTGDWIDDPNLKLEFQNAALWGTGCLSPFKPTALGTACVANKWCASGACQASICRVATCIDQVKDGSETDVDCGGTECAPCGANKSCLVGKDCQSGTCDKTNHCSQLLYHGWPSPIGGCSTAGYNATAPTADGGSYPYNLGDANNCRAWKLAATICRTQPVAYPGGWNGDWYCPSSGGFTDPVFGTYCSVGSQYSCSDCYGACNAACAYRPLSLRGCNGWETSQQ